MAERCLFCRIAQGEIPSHRVHEDAHTFAFLDIRPLRPGHTLVVPKRHAARLEDLSTEDAAHLWATVHRLLPALRRGADAPSATVAVNDGPEAGQEVGHVHVHLVPRRAGDGAGPVHALFGARPSPTPEELARLARSIQGSLAGTA